MPFRAEEKAVFQKQALRAILFEDPEMKILFGMLRTMAPGIILTAKVVGGRLLNAEAAEVEEKIKKVMKGKVSGLSMDGWKGNNRESINSLCANVDFKAYLLELINITAKNKDGPSQCDHFAEMIDCVELNKKGRILLGKKRPWLILPSCWAHQFQLILGNYFKVNNAAAVIAEDTTGLITWLNNHSKVRVIFNEAQRTIHVSSDLPPVEALEFSILRNRPAIIAAQVGVATSTEAVHLKEDAERFCALIRDQAFWEGLETVLGDHHAELATFAVEILTIVANQASCEHTFSRTKIEQSDRRNRLVLAKIDKRTKVVTILVKIRADLRARHARQGPVKSREGGRTINPLPHYCRGSEQAEAAEQVAWNAEQLPRGELNPEYDSDDNSDTPRIPKKPMWKPITLALLFGGAEKPRACKPSAQVMEEEEILRQALADEEEDARPDNGAIEIDSNEEYQ
ncbi:hypothetical protein B0H10DRAFT_1962921 [Mycena sp. CBHHK59/15]|nr:hypothetical protein B0H10DRAFT_1962921 [Mycena sp. CBHHK59/15]